MTTPIRTDRELPDGNLVGDVELRVAEERARLPGQHVPHRGTRVPQSQLSRLVQRRAAVVSLGLPKEIPHGLLVLAGQRRGGDEGEVHVPTLTGPGGTGSGCASREPFMLATMHEGQYEASDMAAYGATEQPAIAARMAPHLRLIWAGTGAAGLAVAAAAGALTVFPTFSGADSGWPAAVVALVASVAMLAVALIQVAVWRRAMASWRGQRIQDLNGERVLSWIAHAASYVVALIALLAIMVSSDYAGWSSAAAVLLALCLLLVLVAQVLAGVQYLRPSGPPGTLPAHLRRLSARLRG